MTATSLGTAIVESAGNAFVATYGTAIAGNGAVFPVLRLMDENAPNF